MYEHDLLHIHGLTLRILKKKIDQIFKRSFALKSSKFQ